MCHRCVVAATSAFYLFDTETIQNKHFTDSSVVVSLTVLRKGYSNWFNFPGRDQAWGEEKNKWCSQVLALEFKASLDKYQKLPWREKQIVHELES